MSDGLRALRGMAARHPVLLAVGLGVLVVILLAALAIPVGLPDSSAGGGPGLVLDDAPVEVAPAEDLSAFLASERWGVVLQDILDEAAAAARAAQEIEMTRELAELGFVGLMVEPGAYAVLLVLPDGKISRLAGGDTLPDGRTLVAVTGNSLTLEADDGQQERLPLFPRVRTE